MCAQNVGIDPAALGSDLHLLRLLIMARTFEEEYMSEEDLLLQSELDIVEDATSE